jgi:hypothetical protein
MRLRRVGVASVAKLFGVLNGAIGLIFGGIMSIAALFGAAIGAAADQGAGAFIGMMFGIGAIILFPVMYGLMGFLMGALMGWLYNVAAGTIGGIEMEFEAPVQPEQSATQTAQ